MKISIIGAGSFGSALAEVCSRCNHEVMLWAHDPRVAEAIAESRSNPVYLPAAQFSSLVRVTNSLEEAARFSDTVLMVTPSHHWREVLTELSIHSGESVRIISATKGIENQTLLRMSEVAAEVLKGRLGKFASLSGPTFALEISREDPSAAVIASTDHEFAVEIQQALSCRSFRLYRSDDVIGVELGGSLKNVVAIAAGVIEGVGFGWNTTAALITRGLHEIRRLGLALGGRMETFAGLAGMGDLILTCTGALSRNRKVGVLLGQGKSLSEILSESRLVAEGIKTSKSAKELADRHGIEMPIISEMYRLLYEGEAARSCIQRLMSRELKPEV
ncbi:MAG TPA: NAD(P)H-dependent glycerol-3-phosphate dehydrogenase [Thermoanaerobaculia bacterium]|nr:NAD(P)H-dependent glycerol-3-phosphate dehydrogenase [Thermoanaerobaculia bacterium]